MNGSFRFVPAPPFLPERRRKNFFDFNVFLIFYG